MDHHKQESRSLIMCTTPLQMLIAEKIIELNQDKQFDLLLIVGGEINDKFLYYYERLEKKCINSMYYIIGKRKKFFKFNDFKKVFLSFMWGYYNNYYLASIDSKYLQWIILGKSNSSLVYTFDDGVANISRSSGYYKNDNECLVRSFIWRILGVNYSINELKEKIVTHYTIYEDLDNIVENTKLIKFFEVGKSSCKNNNVINLFLGQPLYEINSVYTEDFVFKIIDKINIDIYFPHPREYYKIKNNNVEVIETKLIFEDYILSLLENNYFVNVYTFISSAGLNVSSLDNTKVFYLYNDYLKENYADFYRIVEDKNIVLISID